MSRSDDVVARYERLVLSAMMTKGRIDKNYSQKELALLTGLTTQMITRHENGTFGASVERITIILKAFDLKFPDYLLCLKLFGDIITPPPF